MNAAPVDNARLNNVIKLEDDQPIGQVPVEPVDIGCNTQRIHPVAVRLLFAALFQILQSLIRVK